MGALATERKRKKGDVVMVIADETGGWCGLIRVEQMPCKAGQDPDPEPNLARDG